MKSEKLSSVLGSLIYIALGLVLMFYPDIVGKTVCNILGGIAIVLGIVYIAAYLMTSVESRVVQNTNGLAAGIILLILGVFIFIKSEMVIALIPFILGFMISLKGIVGIQNTVNLGKFGSGMYKGNLYAAIIITIFGIIMMLNPFSTAKILFIMIGVGLVCSGLVDILANFIMGRKLK